MKYEASSSPEVQAALAAGRGGDLDRLAEATENLIAVTRDVQEKSVASANTSMAHAHGAMEDLRDAAALLQETIRSIAGRTQG